MSILWSPWGTSVGGGDSKLDQGVVMKYFTILLILISFGCHITFTRNLTQYGMHLRVRFYIHPLIYLQTLRTQALNQALRQTQGSGRLFPVRLGCRILNFNTEEI